MAKMTIGLSTSCIDKLTSVGVILSGAAADDMEVDLFVLVNAGHAFLKSKADKLSNMSEDVQSSEEYIAALEKLSTPSWIEFFEMAKEMTEVKIHICSLAGKIAGGEKWKISSISLMIFVELENTSNRYKKQMLIYLFKLNHKEILS